jgi:hypothetical protein
VMVRAAVLSERFEAFVHCVHCGQYLDFQISERSSSCL